MATKKSARRSERRTMARADARLSMRVDPALEEPEATQIVTESQNISGSGVYCSSDHYLAPLSKVALTIVLPSIPGRRVRQELVKCDGIVVRCEQPSRRDAGQYLLACMFSEIDEAARRRIKDFVTWRNLQALRSVKAPARKAATKRSPRARTSATRTSAARRTSAKATRRRTVH
jgi:c-di-GMP-binding flagellar brake protein YcgR